MTAPRSWARAQGVAQRGAGEPLAELELAAAAHEDAGRLVEQGDQVLVVGGRRGWAGSRPSMSGAPRRVNTSR